VNYIVLRAEVIVAYPEVGFVTDTGTATAIWTRTQNDVVSYQQLQQQQQQQQQH